MQKQERRKLKYDGEIALAIGISRHAREWQNKTLTWGEFVDRLSRTNRTGETMAEYEKLPKTRQDEIKDVGGFVGGNLEGGRRLAANLKSRQLLTLDADFAAPEFWTSVLLMLGCGACVYSTHKHKPDKPRLRLVIPFARKVSQEEYPAICKLIADDIGIDQFDDTTYDPVRLMYFPSTSSDAEFVFEINDEAWLDPDEILARYKNWQDSSSWPESGRTRNKRRKQADKQGDPLVKPGLVGIFCRTYSIPEAISVFLPEIYEPCGEARYTYRQGSSSGGLVLYEEKFAFSYHGTDPISGQLVNAFDLVRIHKFGAPGRRSPSGYADAKTPLVRCHAGTLRQK